MIPNPQYWLLPESSSAPAQHAAQPQGPYTQTDIQQMLGNGTVLPNDLVCLDDGYFHWMEAYHLLNAYQPTSADLYQGEFLAPYSNIHEIPYQIPTPAPQPAHNPHFSASAVKKAPTHSGSSRLLIMAAVFMIALVAGIGYLASINDTTPTQPPAAKEVKDLIASPQPFSKKTVHFIIAKGDAKVIPLPVGAQTIRFHCREGCKYLLSPRPLSFPEIDPYQLKNNLINSRKTIEIQASDRYLIITSGARASTTGKVVLQ